LIDALAVTGSRAVFRHTLDHLRDVSAPTNTPRGKFLATVADGSWGPVDIPLNSISNVSAPTNTPAGKVLGTTATGLWGPVDPPASVDSWGRWVGTRAEYDALPTKDATVLYVITP
jgi:hypothetical protein